MLGKLIKFVILSRMSKDGLILLLSVFMGDVVLFGVLNALMSSDFETGSQLGERMPPGSSTRESILFVALFYTLFSYTEKAKIFKSDLDYLYTLPIDRRKVSVALMVGDAFLQSLLMSSIAVATVNAYALLIALLLGLAMGSLSQAAYHLSGKYRLPLFALVGLWLASPYFGFPFSPLSVVIGDVVPGLVSALAFAAVSFVAMLKSAETLDLAVMASLTDKSEGGDRQANLLITSPFLSVLRLRLSYLGVAARYAVIESEVDISSKPVSFRTVALALAAAGVAYFAILVYLSGDAFLTRLAEVVASVYVGLLGFSVSGLSAVANDRLWPTFTALGARYYRMSVLGSVVQATILVSPIAVAQVVFDALFYAEDVLPTLVAYYAYLPLALGVVIIAMSYLTPTQVREGGLVVNVETRAPNVVFGVLMGLLFFPLVVYIYVPPWVMVALSLILLAVLALSLREEHLYKLVERMTERGYV
ncbi:MAG: hypothetical protein ACP5HQ_01255 [Thermoprotei archaeon]